MGSDRPPSAIFRREVCSRAKCSSGSSHHKYASLIVGGNFIQKPVNVLSHLTIKGIKSLRAIQSTDHDATIMNFDFNPGVTVVSSHGYKRRVSP
jgi:hypothetical protein